MGASLLNNLAVSLLRHALALAHASEGSKCKCRIPSPKGGLQGWSAQAMGAEDEGGACARGEQRSLGRLDFLALRGAHDSLLGLILRQHRRTLGTSHAGRIRISRLGCLGRTTSHKPTSWDKYALVSGRRVINRIVMSWQPLSSSGRLFPRFPSLARALV